jgi:hypothetical protein
LIRLNIRSAVNSWISAKKAAAVANQTFMLIVPLKKSPLPRID